MNAKKLIGVTVYSKEALSLIWKTYLESPKASKKAVFSWSDFFTQTRVFKLDLFESVYQLEKTDPAFTASFISDEKFKQQQTSFNIFCDFRRRFDQLPEDYTWENIVQMEQGMGIKRETFRNLKNMLGLDHKTLGFTSSEAMRRLKRTDGMKELPKFK